MPKKPMITGERILDYIPQRPPVVMVDAFYGVDGDCSYSGFTVPEECVFCREGVLDECALIEHMAQSAALRVGYLCKMEGRPIPLGFIGSTGKCDIVRKALAGEELHTALRVVAEVGSVTLAEAEVCVAGERIAGCTLKIFLQD